MRRLAKLLALAAAAAPTFGLPTVKVLLAADAKPLKN